MRNGVKNLKVAGRYISSSIFFKALIWACTEVSFCANRVTRSWVIWIYKPLYI